MYYDSIAQFHPKNKGICLLNFLTHRDGQSVGASFACALRVLAHCLTHCLKLRVSLKSTGERRKAPTQN
jgi:hypothetical protein